MMTVRKCDAVQETRVTVSRWLRTLVRILSAVLAITGLAAAQADAQDTVLSFDIPSQSLPAALDAFAEQAHVQMLYKADSVRDLQSAPVSGQLSPEQALHHLLQGTGLSFQSGGPNTITVVTPPAEPNHESAPPARDRPRTEKPVKVPEILVKDVQEREGDVSYVAEDTKTATKTDIPLIETPQSISVITRARMQAQEVNSIGEALRYTPGVRGEPFGFDSRLTWLQFRGFDNTTNGLFKDGLQLRNPAFGISYNLEPYGAEQLDVLRGPASFLYGQGSPGGLLNYVSKRPTLQSLHEVQFLAGSFGRYEGRFDFGGRINDSDTFSFRMTGLIRESGTQIDNVPNDRVYIAPALTWRMASTTSLTFFATYQKDRAGAFQWLPADGTLGFNPNGFVQPHRFTGQPSVDRYNRTEHSVGYEFHHQLSENWKFLQKMRYNSNETDNVSTYVLGLEPDRRTAIRDQWSSYGKLTAIALDNQISGRLSTGPMQHPVLAGLDFQRISVRYNQNFAEASMLDIFNRYDYGPLCVVPYFDSKQDTKQFKPASISRTRSKCLTSGYLRSEAATIGRGMKRPTTSPAPPAPRATARQPGAPP
ncbi:MAG: TonB-dependent receptor plug domain-containing protein [Nitrospira sp.]|nr:TonB-dependent receptor plug domain-containing protein [Nitrospira sp.]